MFFRAAAALLLISSLAFAQPATPPAPHVEALTTQDLSSDSVGATPGDFRVDEGGAASYTLPILSLPGTAGLSPKLSLDYSARGSVGAMGTGWMLSGQSAFTRWIFPIAQISRPASCYCCRPATPAKSQTA